MMGLRRRNLAFGIALFFLTAVFLGSQALSPVQAQAPQPANARATSALDDPCPHRDRDDHRGQDNNRDHCNDQSGGYGNGNGNGTPPPPPPPNNQITPPGTPYGVQGYAASSYSINFSWTPGSGQTDGYWVYISPAPGGTAAEQNTGSTSFSLSGVAPGTQYCLTALAYNSAGFSSWSSWGCATAQAAYNPGYGNCPQGYVQGPNGCMPPSSPNYCPAGYYAVPGTQSCVRY